MSRHDDQGPILALELEARNALDIEVLGLDAVVGEDRGQEFPLTIVGDVLESRAGEAEVLPHRLDQGVPGPGEEQRPFPGVDEDPVLEGGHLAHRPHHRTVPKVRLIGVEVDQSNPRCHVVEGPREVIGLLLQVLEDRVVLAEATGHFPCAVPIAPSLTELEFQGSGPVAIVGRASTQEGA